MGRLINEDVLIQRIYEYQSKAIDTEDIIHSIKTMPTAYDVDKVVEELEENKKTATNCRSIFDTKAYVRLDKAVEIVTKGGV